MLGQFADDGLGVLDRIGIRVDRSNVDEVEQDTGALQVLEEADAEAGTVGGSFDQARDGGDGGALSGASPHAAQGGGPRGVRGGGDLRAGCGDGADERALAGVGQAEQADIGEDAQFEAQLALLARLARRRLARGAVGARLEMDVAEATLAASGQQDRFAVDIKIGDDLPAIDIGDDGADWNTQQDVLAAATVAIAGFPVLTSFGEELARVAEFDQGIDIAVGHGLNVTAPSAIAAIRPAFRLILLAPERNHAVAAITRRDKDFGFVDEFHASSFTLSVTAQEKALPQG